MTITEITKQWQTFYAMLGGATATLMGLLFVALAMHSDRIHNEENSHFMRLARLTFSNYLMLLVFSLQMLVPIRASVQLIVPLAGVGVIGLFWSIFLRNKDLDKSDPNAKFIKRSNRMSLIAFIIILGLAIFTIQQPELSLYLLLSPVLMLVVVSVRNSWGLMMMLRSKSDDLK